MLKIKQNNFLAFVLEIVQMVVIALVIVLPIRYLVFQPFIVKGASMEPNFHNGDYLIVDELSYRLREPKRGEVIVFKFPQDESQRFIKRVIGLPGEQVSIKQNVIVITDQLGQKQVIDENLYIPPSTVIFDILNQEISLSENEYFVLGDNRGHSYDSRRWGAVQKGEIIGKALFRAWPLADFGFIFKPDYQD